MEPSPKKGKISQFIFCFICPLEKLADPEPESSQPPQQDELDEEKNNDGDKNPGDQADPDRNEETQHLDELSKKTINIPLLKTSIVGDEIDQSEEVDKRSIYVKNVDYLATREEVIEHFKECGKVNRVTILTDKYTGNPKG